VTRLFVCAGRNLTSAHHSSHNESRELKGVQIAARLEQNSDLYSDTGHSSEYSRELGGVFGRQSRVLWSSGSIRSNEVLLVNQEVPHPAAVSPVFEGRKAVAPSLHDV
jgi:hypothetical protein